MGRDGDASLVTDHDLDYCTSHPNKDQELREKLLNQLCLPLDGKITKLTHTCIPRTSLSDV